MQRTFTSTALAFITDNKYGLQVNDLPFMEDATMLHFYNPPPGCGTPGSWVKVGSATITVVLDSMESAVSSQLIVLNNMLSQHRSDAQMRENEIQDQISKLLALPCEVTQ